MTTVNPQQGARRANDLGFHTASTTPDDALTTGREYLLVVNGHSSAVNITVPVVRLVDDEPVDAKTIAVAAGATALLGPWPPGIYGDTDGRMTFSIGEETEDVKIAVLQF